MGFNKRPNFLKDGLGVIRKDIGSENAIPLVIDLINCFLGLEKDIALGISYVTRVFHKVLVTKPLINTSGDIFGTKSPFASSFSNG